MIPEVVSVIVGSVLGIILEIARRSIGEYITRRRPMSKVFEGLIKNQEECIIVYPSINVTGFIDMKGREIKFPYLPKEKFVTNTYDAIGIAFIYTLLAQAGKTERVREVVSKEFTDQDWESHLMLMASPLANTITPLALERYGAPFRFDPPVKSITSSVPGESWTLTEDYDYGMVVKLSNPRNGKLYFVMAGLGPIGTTGSCYFLCREYRQLAEWYSDREFAIVLRFRRQMGYSEYEIVKRLCLPIDGGPSQRTAT